MGINFLRDRGEKKKLKPPPSHDSLLKPSFKMKT